MNFLKKKSRLDDGIFITEINDKITKKVSDFYNVNPFPNYNTNDNMKSIITKGDRNFLAKEFKKFIGFNKRVLEIGCGTCQLSIYFANSTNNLIVSMDATLESIKIGKKFCDRNYVKNIAFVNADIFDDVFVSEYFDFIWTNGVLHHTKNPNKAFTLSCKYLKKDGYILVGLYNKFGRVRTFFRKFFYKIFGKKFLYFFDPILKRFKISDQERDAWILDQYSHPQESTHTLDEVLDWFEENNIEYISSIPSCSLYEKSSLSLFAKQNKGSYISRLILQLYMIFNKLGSDGGLFVVVGKKKNV